MKVIPVGVPNAPAQSPSPAQSARERAISAYMGGKPDAAEQSRTATERAVNIAAITGNTPVPVDYVQQSQMLAQQEAQHTVNTQETQSQPTNLPPGLDKNTITEPQSQPETEEPLSEKYQVLARKERQLRQQQRQLQETTRQREEALKAKEAELAAKEAQFRDGYISKQRFKEDPLGVMAEAELTYDEITQRQLERPQTDPATLAYIQKLEQKLAKIEEAQNETKKTWETAQSQSYQAAVNQIKTDAKSLVQSNPDQYEAILATGSVKDVVELIEKTYKEEGILMTVEEAADEVENYLFEESLKLANLKKIQSRLKPAVATQASEQQPQATPEQQPQMKTLTNTVGTTKPLSRRERAILAAQGQLKG